MAIERVVDDRAAGGQKLDKGGQISRLFQSFSLIRCLGRGHDGASAMSGQLFKRNYANSSAFLRGVIDGVTSPLRVFPTHNTVDLLHSKTGVGKSFRSVGVTLSRGVHQLMQEQNGRRQK